MSQAAGSSLVRIQVLKVERKSGVAKGSGNAYSMDVLQCVVHIDGDVIVGELVLPKDHEPVIVGEYEATFTVAVDRDKRIGGKLAKLTPIKAQQVRSVG